MHYFSTGFIEYYYYLTFGNRDIQNTASVLFILNSCILNINENTHLFLLSSHSHFDCYLLYETADKIAYKVVPNIDSLHNFFQYYFTNIYAEVFPVFKNNKYNILFKNDILLILQHHPLFKDATYLFTTDVSSLTQLQCIKRISIYNYIILIYEKYLNEHMLLPGHLTSDIMNDIIKYSMSINWFKYKLFMLLRLLKFT